MIINMFVAAAAGTLVPLGLRAANVDPALASSVFITTHDRRVRLLLVPGAGDGLLAVSDPGRVTIARNDVK